MDITLENDERKIKPAIPSLECDDMLNEALEYLAKRSLKQAQIMHEQFRKILKTLERQPGIGKKYSLGLRRIKLGKFRYHVYYRETEDMVKIVGIWHTSQGTDFEEK
ncbi:MAG: type II toxin-antitoxin system RelE/ParE family toxin [Fibromonadaceae bacterium]|jgi:plasmid stabilization system protein ParE|nr:type II toxin-antitoxin system RelE/ParE family toxin [Fibromonadaceae bacterium]